MDSQERVSLPGHFPPESVKTQKMREKLKKYLDEVDQKITPAALQKTIEDIHRWIASNAPNRVPLKNKKISLFDENQNTAKIGPRVRAVVRQLQAKNAEPH